MEEGVFSLLGGAQPVVPMGALLNHQPKFNGIEYSPGRFEGEAGKGLSPHLKAELARSMLERETRKTGMLQLARWQESFDGCQRMCMEMLHLRLF